MTSVESRYTSDQYLDRNPSWDIEDSPWKAKQVINILSTMALPPRSICEVGCGAGGVLAELRSGYPDSELFGFDIAPNAAAFWKMHESRNICFQLGDFFRETKRRYDVLLLLDVIEHLENPFDFLARIRTWADFFVFHIPLDLSAINIIREWPLLRQREKVGHIHYYTKEIALCFLQECNYEVMKWRYTEAALSGPRCNWKTQLANIPRRIVYAFQKDLGVRCLGGETLMVLAKAVR